MKERSVSDTVKINTEKYTMENSTKAYSNVTAFVDNLPKYSQDEVNSGRIKCGMI